jgi:hypothetical protein
MNWLASLLTGGLVEKFTGPLERAWQAYIDASNNEKRLDAEKAIRSIEAARDIAVAEAADRFSAVRLGRWLIVVPFGLWWAACCLIQIINPWLGLNLVVIALPPSVEDMAKILVPAIVVGDAGALISRVIRK